MKQLYYYCYNLSKDFTEQTKVLRLYVDIYRGRKKYYVKNICSIKYDTSYTYIKEEEVEKMLKGFKYINLVNRKTNKRKKVG